MNKWIHSSDVLERLNIKAQTLYAYVSRGLVRTRPDEHNSRKKLYSEIDVEALERRQSRPRGRNKIAMQTINWGDPVLNSAISTVRDGKLIFGNHLATDLADTLSLEQVAGLHWGVEGYKHDNAAIYPIPNSESPRLRGFIFLSRLSDISPPILGRTREALVKEASGILSGFANSVLGMMYEGEIHERIRSVWGLPSPAADHIRRLLILISDHELNPSTFAVRVAASSGASLPACAMAGYATLTGPLHGNASRYAYKLLSECLSGTSPSDAISERLGRDSYEYGFGHPLYPNGDDRANYMLNTLKPGRHVLDILDGCERVLGQKPNIDAAMAVLKNTHHLRDDSLFSLFAIARMAGWLGHAIEQTLSDMPIRPRARFSEPV